MVAINWWGGRFGIKLRPRLVFSVVISRTRASAEKVAARQTTVADHGRCRPAATTDHPISDGGPSVHGAGISLRKGGGHGARGARASA